ncbi:hypothetical protein C8R46DRAFT_1191292 [Mycena filopes]|nr:hypothetical protein C8R46DRAFT_1191292 [Mycena filopes]
MLFSKKAVYACEAPLQQYFVPLAVLFHSGIFSKIPPESYFLQSDASKAWSFISQCAVAPVVDKGVDGKHPDCPGIVIMRLCNLLTEEPGSILAAGGELSTTQTFRTTELPQLVRRKKGAWDPQVRLECGESFLSFLLGVAGAQEREHKSEGNGRPRATVWHMPFRPNVGAELGWSDPAAKNCSKDEDDKAEEEVEGVGFLPRWYWDEVSWSDEEER